MRYSVDAEDIIQSVCPEWLAFAESNGSAHLNREAVVGESLWSFITGKETRHLYQLVFARLRESQGVAVLPFRCDSPTLRRFMELELRAMDDSGIELEGRLMRTEERPPPSGLHSTRKMVTICSWCKLIQEPDGSWCEIEEALQSLDLFRGESELLLTHGACPACHEELLRRLESSEP